MATTQNPGSTPNAGNTGPDVSKLKKDIEEIASRLKAAGAGIGFDLQKAFATAKDDVTALENVFKKLNKEYDELVNRAEETYIVFRDITAELQNQNASVKQGKSSFRELTDIARDLNNYTRGTADLTRKQLKSLEQNLAIETKELQTLVSILQINERSRISEIERLKNQENNKEKLKAQIALLEQQKQLGEDFGTAEEMKLKNLIETNKVTEGLSTTQKKRLANLQKEQEVLISSKGALKEGIPIIERELDLSKQIFQTRQDIGGITTKIGKFLSSVRLGEFLDLSKATESAENYSKTLVQNALNSKEVQEKLLKIEEKRNSTALAADRARQAIQKSNLSEQEKQNKLRQIDTSEAAKLSKLDKDALQVKKDAVKSTDTLGNKFGVLKVFAKDIGEGLKKSLLDPVTLFIFFVGQALKADKQVTELNKSLGISKGLANDMRQSMARFTRDTNDAFVTTERLMKAQSELSKELGIAVKFSNQELATFAKLTELTGLTAAEAGKLSLFSAAAGKTTEKYTADIRTAAYHAQQATKTHFSSKEILQDISKLSSGILVKFQNNPKAIAEAVVQAKALGTTLEQVDRTAEHLLNFEQSIENELKAELITGKQLNLERARAAALTGDQATLMKEVAKQTGTLADFQKMNVIAQKSLAGAFGMSREEMADMLMKQELINKYGDKAAELNAQQAAELKKSGLSLEDYLKKQEQQQSAQDKFNDAVTKFQEIIGNLVAGPFGQLLDMLAGALNIINQIASFAAKIGESFGGLTGVVAGLIPILMNASLIARTFAITGFRGAIAAIFRSFSSIPFGIGIPLAIAAVAGLTAMFSKPVKADDLASEGGYGNRTLIMNKGSLPPEVIKLNNNDNLYATTNKIQPTARPTPVTNPIITPAAKPSNVNFDSTSIVKAVGQLASATMEMSKRPVTAQINGKEAFADNLGRVNALGTSQTRNTYSFA